MARTARDFGLDREAVVAARIRRRRAELGKTQNWVRDRLFEAGLPLSKSQYSIIERGGASVDVGKLVVFAAALETTVTYLLALTEDHTSWAPDKVLELKDAGVAERSNANPLRAVPGPKSRRASQQRTGRQGRLDLAVVT